MTEFDSLQQNHMPLCCFMTMPWDDQDQKDQIKIKNSHGFKKTINDQQRISLNRRKQKQDNFITDDKRKNRNSMKASQFNNKKSIGALKYKKNQNDNLQQAQYIGGQKELRLQSHIIKNEQQNKQFIKGEVSPKNMIRIKSQENCNKYARTIQTKTSINNDNWLLINQRESFGRNYERQFQQRKPINSSYRYQGRNSLPIISQQFYYKSMERNTFQPEYNRTSLPVTHYQSFKKPVQPYQTPIKQVQKLVQNNKVQQITSLEKKIQVIQMIKNQPKIKNIVSLSPKSPKSPHHQVIPPNLPLPKPLYLQQQSQHQSIKTKGRPVQSMLYISKDLRKTKKNQDRQAHDHSFYQLDNVTVTSEYQQEEEGTQICYKQKIQESAVMVNFFNPSKQLKDKLMQSRNYNHIQY